jgi:uncharacterized protein (TIGR03437 family)
MIQTKSMKNLIGSLSIALLLIGHLLAQSTPNLRKDNQVIEKAKGAVQRKNARKADQTDKKSQPNRSSVNGSEAAAIGDGVFTPGKNTDGLNAFSYDNSSVMELVGLGSPERAELKPYDEPDKAIEFHRLKRLPEGENEIPIERYLEAKELADRMPQYSTVLERSMPSRLAMAAEPDQGKLGTWTPLGPGNIGGRTRAMLINPQDPNIIYSAGVAGGVWKSTNAGGSWTPLTDLLPNIAVNSLAFDPTNPNTIYAGTGEGFFNSDGVRGAGIFKTTDGGMNWARLANTATFDFYYVNDIVVSRNDNKRLYAATRTGLWRSADGGDNWTNVRSTTVQGGCLDLAIRTDKTTDFIFASCGSFAQARIYRNTDAGGAGTWDEVHTESGMGRTSLALAPSDQNIIYAISSGIFSGNALHALHAVFRSTASGDPGSWSARVRSNDPLKINTALFTNPLLLFQTDCRIGSGNAFLNQGWYDNVIAVDPLDPNRVWAGGIDLFRSDDGGANWGVASYWWAASPGQLDGPPQYAHADHHAIQFHPQYNGGTNQTMFIGGDGGVFRTENARAPVAAGNAGPCDPGNSQVRWTALNNNYGVTQFYHGSVYPDGKSYLGGTQDNGTIRGTDTGGVNAWLEINGGDGGYTAVDTTDPDTLFAAFTGISIRKSSNNGSTFHPAVFGISDGGLFISPYMMDPSDSQRLYVGGASLWRTTNGAAQWSRVASLATVGGTVSAIAISPTDANSVIVGLSTGSVVRTNRALTLNQNLSLGSPNEVVARPRAGFVSWVTFDPTNRDIAYATYSTFDGGAHVWRTTNGGVSWMGIDGTGGTAIPNIPVHCIVVDPSNTARLYVGTDLGVFVSTDGGASWSVENTGFANTVTESISLNVVDGATTLYAFTHGRGAYKVVANMSGCRYSITPPTRSFGRDGGDAVVNVTGGPNGCNWSASSNMSWITLGPNAGGSGNGAVAMKIEANRELGTRAGTVSIAGRSFTVVQEGFPDDIPPALAINSPVTSPTNSTAGSINLGGVVSDNVRVVSLNWQTDRGISGSSGTASPWAILNIPLTAGRNVITVTATDESGNVSRASQVVDATPASVITTVAGTGTSGFSGDNGPAPAANINGSLLPVFDSAGNMYFADFNNQRIRKVTPQGIISTIAGNGTAGFLGDGGPAISAQLSSPISAAIDSKGNIYITDRGNNRIRKVTAGTGVISTFVGTGAAGYGGDNGPATAALINAPNYVAVDSADNLYIADTGNNRIRKVDAATGNITSIAGTGSTGFSGDGGPATAAQLRSPVLVALDNAGDIYITDNANFRIRKITAGSGVINTIAGTGSSLFSGDGGPATSASFGSLLGFAIDSAKNIYIADTSNGRIRMIAANTGIITTIAGSPVVGFSPDGTGAIGARFNSIQGIALDPSGALYLSEFNNFRIRKIVPAVSGDAVSPQVRMTAPTDAAAYTATGSSINLSGTASDNNQIVAVRWSNDRGGSGAAFGLINWTTPNISLENGLNNITVTAWDANGNVGSAQLAVTFSLQQVIVTVAGTGVIGSTGDGGPGTAAQLWLPRAVAVDNAGNIFICDTQNHRVRKVSPNGIITAFAGSGALGSGGDGGPATGASMNEPRGVIVDAAGNVYIADSQNNKVRRVTPDGKIDTYAGTGRADFGGDGGPAKDAFLSFPLGLALDSAGNLYLSDNGNNRIRRVNASDGKITTIAGNGFVGFDGDDGPAPAAILNFPAGVAVDGAGNIYLVDQGNARVRRVGVADGKISTVAGTGTFGYNGDGIAATSAHLNQPRLMAVDAAGDIYIADQGNHRIRKVTVSTGMITTVAGSGVAGPAGDGGAASTAQFSVPTDVKVDGAGNLYIADGGNHRIRRTLAASALRTVANVSAASFIQSGNLASEAIAAAFGNNLANSSLMARAIPLPSALGGTTVKVRDNAGVERLSGLFSAAPGQVNYLVPNGTANGVATVTITSGDGTISSGTVNIATISPGLFAANMNGQGVAAAIIFRRQANGQESYESVSRLDPATNRFIPAPIDLGPEGDQVYLLLFGTGFRFRSAVSNSSAIVGGVNTPLLYAGVASGFYGLDQANLRLDRSLIGKGEVDVILTVDGISTNLVKINVK